MARVKFHFILICCYLFMNAASLAQTTNIGFHFHGLENKRIILGYYEGNKQYLKDSIQLDGKGESSWNPGIRSKEGMYFVILPGSRYFDLLIAGSQPIEIFADTSELVGKMKITPESESSNYLNYQKAARLLQVQYDKYERKLKYELSDSIRSIRQQMREITLQLEKLKDSLATKYKGSLTSKILQLIRNPSPSLGANSTNGFRQQYLKAISTYTDVIDLSDERLLRTPFVWARLDSYFNHLLVQRNDSLMKAITSLMNKAKPYPAYQEFFSKWLLDNYSQKKFPGSEKTFVFIAREYFLQPNQGKQDSVFLARLKEKTERTQQIVPGAVATNLELPDTSGKIHSLEETQKKDVLLLFYDSECGPCKYMKSQITALLNKLDSRNICVYAINLGNKRNEWLRYIKGTGPEWVNLTGYSRKELLSDTYMFEFLPALFLIGEDKKIVAGNVNFTEAETILRNKYSFTKKQN